MKSVSILALAGAVAAAPQNGGLLGTLLAGNGPFYKAAKAASNPNNVQDDVKNGACKAVTFIMGRASTEPGNMGGSVGPQICDGLKKLYPNEVACQGVGGPYTAGLGDNIRSKGTSDAAIAEAQSDFRAAAKCAKTTIVAAGYSQGSALMNQAVGTLDAATKARVAAVVLFGYTKNKQTSSSIVGYPKDQTKVYCVSDDGVCGGGLQITDGHFAYVTNGDAPDAVKFLASKIPAGAAAGAASAGAAAPAAAAPAAASVGPFDNSGSGSSAAPAAAAPASGLSSLFGGSSLFSGLLGGNGGGSSLFSGLRSIF